MSFQPTNNVSACQACKSYVFASPTVKYQDQFEAKSPPAPFRTYLPAGLPSGRYIAVAGFAPRDADSLAINLLNSNNGNIMLHIKRRFTKGQLARNTKENNVWGKEEYSTEFPSFDILEYFEIKIKNEENEFVIYLNGAKICTYPHRLPFEDIDAAEVEGAIYMHFFRYN
ncbi:galectin-4-like [Gastrophryne carolinensis]